MTETNYDAVRVVLIRGLPGSGKSTLARLVCDGFALQTSTRKHNILHMETDQYWYIGTGTYQFDPSKLRQAHEWCQNQFSSELAFNVSEIAAGRLDRALLVVSNTFTTASELKFYVERSREFGIAPQIITLHGNYGSIHNVPEATMQKMAARFDYNLKSLGE